MREKPADGLNGKGSVYFRRDAIVIEVLNYEQLSL